MRIIFLDVDGVLNCSTTQDRFHGIMGIDPELVANLAELVKESEKLEETRIVLSSSWRMGVNTEGVKIPDSYVYLKERLKEANLEIYDDTPRLKWSTGSRHRGREIAGWLYLNRDKEISSYVILDDIEFKDFEKYGMLARHVKTSLFTGGLQKEHIRQALNILNQTPD